MTARFPHCFGSSAICRFFCAIALAFSFATRAATVTGPIQNATGTPFNGQFRQFQFTPIGNPQVINGITVWTCPVTTLITNGTFSTNLDGGMYWVGYVGEGVNGQTPKVAKALVPPFDTNTYTLGQCLQFATNGSTFYWTNQPTLIAGTNVLFTTNGAYLVINSTASGGGLTTNQAALLTNSMQQGATILPSSITLGGSNVTTWAQLGGGGGNSHCDRGRHDAGWYASSGRRSIRRRQEEKQGRISLWRIADPRRFRCNQPALSLIHHA